MARPARSLSVVSDLSEVIVLGSGSSIPSPGRRPPAFLVKAPEATLLIDCGAGASNSLCDCGVSLAELDGIFLTHLHPDHCADLVPILFALHNPVGPPREEPLRVWGPAGLTRHWDDLVQVYGTWVVPRSGKPIFTEIAGGAELTLQDCQVFSHSVQHGIPAVAYRIEAGGEVLCFSGDTRPCEGLERAAANASIFFSECCAHTGETSGHMRPEDVGLIAAKANCKQVVLTHLPAHFVAGEALAQIQHHYAGRVDVAYDLMRVQF